MLPALYDTMDCDFEDIDQCGYFHNFEKTNFDNLWQRDYKSSSTSDHGKSWITVDYITKTSFLDSGLQIHFAPAFPAMNVGFPPGEGFKAAVLTSPTVQLQQPTCLSFEVIVEVMFNETLVDVDMDVETNGTVQFVPILAYSGDEGVAPFQTSLNFTLHLLPGETTLYIWSYGSSFRTTIDNIKLSDESCDEISPGRFMATFFFLVQTK